MADTNSNSNSNNKSNGGIVGVASKTVSALAGFPMLLVLALLNASTLGMVTYLTLKAGQFRAQERTELIQLLRNCVIKHIEKNGGTNYNTPGWNDESTKKADQHTP